MAEKYIKLKGGFTIIAKVNDDGKTEYDEDTLRGIICRVVGRELSNNKSINLWYNCSTAD